MVTRVNETLLGLLAAVPGVYLLHVELVVELGVDLLADKLVSTLA